MLKYFPFLVAATLLLCTSCQKELSFENGSQADTTATYSLRMKINGSSWAADSYSGAQLLSGMIQISGISKDKKTFSIVLNDTIVGTYRLAQSSLHTAALSDSADLDGATYTTSQGNDTSDAGGTVIITSINKAAKTISGTFSFKMYRDQDKKQKVITEGVFDKLPYTTTVAPSVSTDTFTVKIDGAPWTSQSINGTASGGTLVVSATDLTISKAIGLSMPAAITPGTYGFSTSGSYIGVYNTVTASYLSDNTGKLIILENNPATKRIRGNFNFTGKEINSTSWIQMSEGYFSLTYH